MCGELPAARATNNTQSDSDIMIPLIGTDIKANSFGK